MITKGDLKLLDSLLNRLKSNLYGLKAEYNSELIEKNIEFNKSINLGYRPSVIVNTYLTGDLKIPIVSTGVLEQDLKQSLERSFKFIFPAKHPIKNAFAILYKFFYNGVEIPKNEMMTSNWYNTYREDFISNNKSGKLVLNNSSSINISVNYYDLKLEETSDIEDLYFAFLCKIKSFNYEHLGTSKEITENLWDEFEKISGSSPKELKEFIISVFNTKSTDYGTNITDEFATTLDLWSKFPAEVIDNIGWKYEALCYSLENPNEVPWDYSSTDIDNVKHFQRFLEEKFKN